MASDEVANPAVSMTLDEAYVLHRWHLDVETDATKRRDYGAAAAHRDRAAEIGHAFWPAGQWERAWSNQT